MGTNWERWCRQYRIDPDTSDETMLDAYLHDQAPAQWRNRAQREYYAGWASYTEARERLPPQIRQVQTDAEIVELERWLRL